MSDEETLHLYLFKCVIPLKTEETGHKRDSVITPEECLVD